MCGFASAQADSVSLSASDQTLKEVAQTLLDVVTAMPDARVAKFAPRYKLVFSLLNEDSSSGGALLEWDIQTLLKRELHSGLGALPCLIFRLRRTPSTAALLALPSPHF